MNNTQYHNQSFRHYIRKIRKLCGLTQDEFASRIGISTCTLSRLETSRCPLLKIEHIAIMWVVEHEIDNGNLNLQRYMNALDDTDDDNFGVADSDYSKYFDDETHDEFDTDENDD